MRLCVAMLGLLFLVGCDKPIITIDLKGQPNIPAQPAPPRFQIVMHHEFPGQFTFLLDTQTGAIWRPKTQADLDGKPTAWSREMILDVVPSSGLSPLELKDLLVLFPPTTKKEEVKP